MGYEELIRSLQEEADEKVRQLRNDAFAEAERIREDASKRVDRARSEYEEEMKNIARKIQDNILFDAEKKAKEIILRAEKKLSDLLFSHAMTCLHSLRSEGYGRVFTALAGELPHFQWKEVRVASEDVEYAKELFPHACIVPDGSITGGLEVHSENGRICIINTFEKRLERAWEGMLPLIMQEVCNSIQ